MIETDARVGKVIQEKRATSRFVALATLLLLGAALLVGMAPGSVSFAHASALKATDTVTLTIIGGASSENPSSNADYLTLVNKQYAGEAILAAAQSLDSSKTYDTLTAEDLLAAAWKAGDIKTYAMGADGVSGRSGSDVISLTAKDGTVFENWSSDAYSAQLNWKFYQKGSLSATTVSSTPLTANASYQFCWVGQAYAGTPGSWPIFYLEHKPEGLPSTGLLPSATLTVVDETVPASDGNPATYGVWANRRILLEAVLQQVRQTNPEATTEMLTVKDLLATAQAENHIGGYELGGSEDSRLTSLTSASGEKKTDFTSPRGDLRLYWAFYDNNHPAAFGISQGKLEGGHYYQLVWDMATTALAPTNWTSFYTDFPAQKATISPAAQYTQGWNRLATGQWVYKKDGALITNTWARIGGAWYHFDSNSIMQTGWFKQNSTWYYLTEAGQEQAEGSAAVGWRKVHGTWYYFRTASEGVEGSMVAKSWLHKGSTWYYLKDSGAMATGWESLNGKWYYLNPESGAMKTGWQRVRGVWYYLQPGSGAMQTGWLKLGKTWYYLAPGSGAMQTGWYWVGSKCYYSVTSGAMAHDRWVGSYWVGSDGAWDPSASR